MGRPPTPLAATWSTVLFRATGTLHSRRATGSIGAPRTSVTPEVALTSSVACQSWRVQPRGHRDRVGWLIGMSGGRSREVSVLDLP